MTRRASLPYVHVVKRAIGFRFTVAGQRYWKPLPSRDDPSFMTEYAKLVEYRQSVIRASKAGDQHRVAQPGTIRWLINEYQKSPEFKRLSEATHRHYQTGHRRIITLWGGQKATEMTRADVHTMRDTIAAQRGANAGDAAVNALKALMSWAEIRGHIKTSPVVRVEKLGRIEGHRPWDDSEIAAFRTHWPLGTFERTFFEVGLGTGQRRKDIVGMRWDDIADGIVSVMPSKTGKRATDRLHIPLMSAVREALAAWERQGESIFITRLGKVISDSGASTKMGAAFKACGVSQTIHGLRFTFPAMALERGIERDLIKAITGHKTDEMLDYYLRKKRAAEAMSLMENAG